jgi:hypothetical protein
MNKGDVIWAIDRLYRYDISSYYCINLAKIGGNVNADAIPIISLKNNSPKDLIGNDFC